MFSSIKKTDQVDLMMFVLYDSKVGNYRDPIFSPNSEVLVRTIVNEFTDERYQKTDMFLNAEDFSIFKIGTFDRKTGKITITGHDHVINMVEIRALANRKMLEKTMEVQKELSRQEAVQASGH